MVINNEKYDSNLINSQTKDYGK